MQTSHHYNVCTVLYIICSLRNKSSKIINLKVFIEVKVVVLSTLFIQVLTAVVQVHCFLFLFHFLFAN